MLKTREAAGMPVPQDDSEDLDDINLSEEDDKREKEKARALFNENMQQTLKTTLSQKSIKSDKSERQEDKT